MSGANGGSNQDELARGREDFLNMVNEQTALLNNQPDLTRYLEARINYFELAFVAVAVQAFTEDIISGAPHRGNENNRMMFITGFLAAYAAIGRGDVQVMIAEHGEESHDDTQETPG